MKRKTIALAVIFMVTITAFSQEKPSLENHSFYASNLIGGEFKSLMDSKIKHSQFIFLGEHHGIVEVGEITEQLYSLSEPYGFKTLCIETDKIAAFQIEEFLKAKDPVAAAKSWEEKYPFSIPFYNNVEDYEMFKSILKEDTSLWGIDQTFVGQFRMNFNHLISTTDNKALKKELIPLKEKAEKAFVSALETKNPMAPYIFQYDESTHNKLLHLVTNPEEKEIIEQLMKTKEIYGYYFKGQSYWNNEIRGILMKQNFLNYYNDIAVSEKKPKVLFKIGYNHAARGLTMTNIYDIGNLGAELAIMNKMKSLHILAMGVSGREFRANPFNPSNKVREVNNDKYLPEEFLDLASKSSQKYVVIKTQELRPFAKNFSEKVMDFIFKFDVVILINDAIPLSGF